MTVPDLYATCFECNRRFKVYKNGRVCPGCVTTRKARTRHTDLRHGWAGGHEGLATRSESPDIRPIRLRREGDRP